MAPEYFNSMVTYIDFGNGSGVRALCMRSHAVMPITSQELFYSFQGLTSDGAYYVAARLPISTPVLPADGSQVPDSEIEWMMSGDAAAVDVYLADTRALLEAQAPEGFTPNLAPLDAMIQSIVAQGACTALARPEVVCKLGLRIIITKWRMSRP